MDVLFPPRCAACGGPGWPLCVRCARRVGVISPPWCRRCGRPTEEPVARCADCPPGAVDVVRAPFLYRGPVARAVKGMKFSGWHALGPHFAGAMALMCEHAGDVVTWVPLSRRRLARRGFDQAEVLARAVAPLLGRPVQSLLSRDRDVPAQARRGGRDRRTALAGAFTAAGSSPRRVLLVDDVVTTGSTAAACATVLRAAGARWVGVLAVARSLGDPLPERCFGPGVADEVRVP